MFLEKLSILWFDRGMQEDEDPDILAKLRSFGAQNLLILGLGLLGLIFLGVGLIQIFNHKPPDVQFTENNTNSSPLVKDGSEKIMVDIEGAVLHPGVYSLAADSRIQDALIASGGLSSSADRDFVQKSLNLAQKISDGTKIFIPKQGEAGAIGAVAGIQTASGLPQSGTININTASIDGLDTLSGIGKVTAQKIIDARPFLSLDDLLKKKIVSQKVFDKIRDKLSL